MWCINNNLNKLTIKLLLLFILLQNFCVSSKRSWKCMLLTFKASSICVFALCVIILNYPYNNFSFVCSCRARTFHFREIWKCKIKPVNPQRKKNPQSHFMHSIVPIMYPLRWVSLLTNSPQIFRWNEFFLFLLWPSNHSNSLDSGVQGLPSTQLVYNQSFACLIRSCFYPLLPSDYTHKCNNTAFICAEFCLWLLALALLVRELTKNLSTNLGQPMPP